MYLAHERICIARSGSAHDRRSRWSINRGVPSDAHVVFDKVGTTYALSELWAQGVEGILLQATEGKHEHEVLHVHQGRD